ncbi:MAG TPA: ATP-binding protein [Magnetovibrio sp.]
MSDTPLGEPVFALPQPSSSKADSASVSWIDRPIFVEIIFFIIGAAILCTLGFFQKLAIGADVTHMRGYIVPFFFGGASWAFMAYLNRRSRSHLTARIKAQAERDILLSASTAKSECMAAMSHELRTPLNAILGFSSSIKNETFGPLANAKYSEYIDDISNSGQHLLELINDILDISAIEVGKLTLHEGDVNVGNLAKDVLHVLQHMADGDEVKLVLNAQVGLPPLFADERRYRQILLNLTSNAIKFTPPGGTVTMDLQVNDGGEHVLCISDTGIGMDRTELEQAMCPFGQVDSRLARRHEGTGLGLPLTKGLVELHGGELVITSTKGAGTTVQVTFPKERTAAAPSFSI